MTPDVTVPCHSYCISHTDFNEFPKSAKPLSLKAELGPTEKNQPNQ